MAATRRFLHAASQCACTRENLLQFGNRIKRSLNWGLRLRHTTSFLLFQFPSLVFLVPFHPFPQPPPQHSSFFPVMPSPLAIPSAYKSNLVEGLPCCRPVIPIFHLAIALVFGVLVRKFIGLLFFFLAGWLIAAAFPQQACAFQKRSLIRIVHEPNLALHFLGPCLAFADRHENERAFFGGALGPERPRFFMG